MRRRGLGARNLTELTVLPRLPRLKHVLRVAAHRVVSCPFCTRWDKLGSGSATTAARGSEEANADFGIGWLKPKR